MRLRLSILLVVIGSLMAIAATAQKQGIKGQVFWVSGNQMPSPDKNKSVPRQGIVREIHIYNAVTLNQTRREGSFYKNIDAIRVAKIQSNPDGTFKIKLPPGRYSVFTLEDRGLFANLTDGNGCINCIEVSRKKYTWMTITIDYEAAY
jgi:hypothetical protein